jgi:hypothetical protein
LLLLLIMVDLSLFFSDIFPSFSPRVY